MFFTQTGSVRVVWRTSPPSGWWRWKSVGNAPVHGNCRIVQISMRSVERGAHTFRWPSGPHTRSTHRCDLFVQLTVKHILNAFRSECVSPSISRRPIESFNMRLVCIYRHGHEFDFWSFTIIIETRSAAYRYTSSIHIKCIH